MIFRRTIPILVASAWLSPVASAQRGSENASTAQPSSSAEHTLNLSDVVFPITSVTVTPRIKVGITGDFSPTLHTGTTFGTGFCLDAECRFIGTNYHVAATTKPHKIRHQKIVHRYFATGPDDKEATANALPNGEVLAYSTGRDLAIFELLHPLAHHHGLSFSLDELEAGREVDIYGYPLVINPIRKLARFPAAFKAPTTSGLLSFEYRLSAAKTIRLGGASGGLVVDRKSKKIVGILCATTEKMALAVPVETLADFVSKVQPFLAQKLFSSTMSAEVLPVSTDLYPKFVPDRVNALQRRAEEPYEVSVLRQKAESLADGLRNYIAVQTYSWSSGDKPPAAEAEYEVRVIDGVQKFREYPDGTKELDSVPFPKLSAWMNPADEWSTLPKMVATEYRLKVQQAPDAVVRGRPMKIFQYYASVEDNVCPFQPIEDFGFFKISKILAVACYGEVWTDEDTNILRVSKNLDLSEKLKAYRGWEECQVVITYGWLKQEDETPRLVPLTILSWCRSKTHIYWCRGQFTDYRVFSSRAKVVASEQVNPPMR